MPLVVRTARHSLVYEEPPHALLLTTPRDGDPAMRLFKPDGCYGRPEGPGGNSKRWCEEVRDRMRKHYRSHRGWWTAMLARDQLLLLCDCGRPESCVRGVLAEALVKLGAVYEGEEVHPPAPAIVASLRPKMPIRVRPG